MSVHVTSFIWKHGPDDRSELVVMLALADFSNDEGLCWPSMKSLAERTRMTERGVQKIIRRLEAAGWLSVDAGGGRHGCNNYRLKTENPEHETPNPVHPEPRSPRTGEQKPRTRVQETPNGGSPEPSKNHQEPSVREILCEVLSEEVADAYLDHRKSKRAKITANAARILVKKLKGHPAPDAVVEESIANGWTGVFPEKSRPSQQYGPRQSQAQSWTAGAQIPSDIFKDTPPPARNN